MAPRPRALVAVIEDVLVRIDLMPAVVDELDPGLALPQSSRQSLGHRDG
jgi:hypothetical protein